MKKCVAAIKALEGARCKLERAVADEAARHRQAEAAAAAGRCSWSCGAHVACCLHGALPHRVAQDATEALLQHSLEAAAALHQRLAAVELQVAAPRPKRHATQPGSPYSSPGIAAVRGGAAAAVEHDEHVHVNPLFAAGGASRTLGSAEGTLPSSVARSGGTASPASRTASATLSSIAVKLKELQRHLQSTPVCTTTPVLYK